MKKLFILIFLFGLLLNLYPQNREKIDSIEKRLDTVKNDSVKGYLNFILWKEFYSFNSDSANYYINKIIELSKKQDEIHKGKIYQFMGDEFFRMGLRFKSLKYYQKSLNIYIEIQDSNGIARCYSNIGQLYYSLSRYPESISNYMKALQIYKTQNDIKGLLFLKKYISDIYIITEEFNKVIQLRREVYDLVINNQNYFNDFDRAMVSFFLGEAYLLNNNDSLALKYFNESLIYGNKPISKHLSNYPKQALLGNVYRNMADIEKKKNNYSKAIKLYKTSVKLLSEVNYTSDIASSYIGIGNSYSSLNNFKQAIIFYNKGYNIAKKTNDIEQLRNVTELLNLVYEKSNNINKAYEFYKLYHIYDDSLKQLNSINEIQKTILQFNFDMEKKQSELEYQNKYLRQHNEIVKQKLIKNSAIVIIFIIILGLFFAIKGFINKKRANILITTQKNEIEEKNSKLNKLVEEISTQRDDIFKQKEIIEEIHHEISQSIDYATRLQGAILPESEILEKYLSEHFVLFKPKNKVSGDFYWWAHIENHTIITAADCTGHGVPGAFMSMLGTSFLREIVQKEYITHTGVILRKLRKEIIKALKQKGEQGEQKDGMDMAIVSIDHKTNIVQFSGANNPLYIVKNGELKVESGGGDAIKLYKPDELFNFKLYEIKPDKMPIAIYEKMDDFTTYEIQLEKGDLLYMFSDGFADQFGGIKGKKFKYKPFKHLLLKNANKPMEEQKKLLNTTFEDWKGNLEQIDDVVVIGIKI